MAFDGKPSGVRGRKRFLPIFVRAISRDYNVREARKPGFLFYSADVSCPVAAFRFHGLLGARLAEKRDPRNCAPRDYNAATADAIRISCDSIDSNSCPSLRSAAACGFDLQPANGITHLGWPLGHNRGQNRGNVPRSPTSTHRRVHASDPREETPSRVIKSISRPANLLLSFPFAIPRRFFPSFAFRRRRFHAPIPRDAEWRASESLIAIERTDFLPRDCVTFDGERRDASPLPRSFEVARRDRERGGAREKGETSIFHKLLSKRTSFVG